MDPLSLFIVAWIICGGIAWRVAKHRRRNGPLWVAIGQVLGPLAIPLAFLL